MVSPLLAGIKPSSLIEGAGRPESLTRTKTPPTATTAASFKSEWWPDSSRNGGRLHLGTPGRIKSESGAPLRLWVDLWVRSENLKITK
jgi:hypothetical protein